MDTVVGMRTFVAVATHGSFTAGAHQLGISVKLASKYVRQLESHLGAQLLNRTTRSVTLTATGSAYLERCVPLLQDLEELEGLVQERQAELAGPIRLTAPTAFGSIELIDAIQPFQLLHPKVTIDLHLADQRLAIIEEGFDLAIRFGGLTDSSLIARKLMDMRVVVFASPIYLERQGNPDRPEDLAAHNCLLQRSSADPSHWRFRVSDELTSVRVNGNFQANSPRAIAQAAAAGLGIGMGPLYVVEPYLGNGTLALLFEAEEATEFGLYAVYPPSRHLTARIRALIDHLAGVYGSKR